MPDTYPGEIGGIGEFRYVRMCRFDWQSLNGQRLPCTTGTSALAGASHSSGEHRKAASSHEATAAVDQHVSFAVGLFNGSFRQNLPFAQREAVWQQTVAHQTVVTFAAPSWWP